MLKNTIQAILADNGISLPETQKTMLSSETDAIKMLEGYEVSPASWVSVQINLKLLWEVEEYKKRIRKEILFAGEPFADASPCLRLYYSPLISRRGVGRARIAVIRKICGVMRRMLLDHEPLRWMQTNNFERKLKRYENQLQKIKKNKGEERKSA